jgi:serine/threonine protein kinase
VRIAQEIEAMPSEASKPTMQIVGDYELLEKVADGGMGTVYKGRNRSTGQIVAVKLVAPNMATNEVFLQRFKNEFNAASKLDHPNIVRALEFGSASGRPYLVMEFIDGETLGQRVEREGAMPEPEAIRCIALAAQGLQRAHKQGLIHRDVKPDNIMITADGTIKLADLGLVKEVDGDVNLTRTGRGLGTPHFMAPEQFRNAKYADERCDIYSLAATLYMMVTGKVPFQALGPLEAWMKKINNELTPPRKVVPSISERTDQAIRRAMDADPKVRPATCREFVEDLTGQGGSRKTASRVPMATTVGAQDLWYLVYKDENGVKHMVKGTAAGIRRSLKEGRLGDASNVLAGRTKETANKPVLSYPEFAELAENLEQPVATARPGSAPTTADSQSRTPTSGVHLPLDASSGGTLAFILKLLLFIGLAVISGVAAAFFFNNK